MLIIVPSSEGKRAPATTGAPLDPDRLSFPTLAAVRARILDALVTTSRAPDALARLGVGTSIAGEVARNRQLASLPASPALEVYDGVLHRALDAASLDAAAAARAAHSLVLASSLFGLLRPDDRIPPYRLPVGARLLDLPRLEACWRPLLGDVLADAAGSSGVILDLRASSYQALGSPALAADRTVALRLAPGVAGGNVTLKRLRGLAARRLLEAPSEPGDPDALAALLARDWTVELAAPARAGAPYTLSVAP
jgi:cytoplasmic iron level regulating protein YaaA (DUF328/UPF0246 family)